jgi:ATP/maltotriose-dependent transcriptional regulator MalT
VLTFGEHARALLYNGLGRHAAALAPAQSASALDEPMASVWALPELVEAASRCGKRELAADAFERLAERTRVAGTDLALGMEARARALVSEGALAEELYREALDRLGRCRLALELARARLLYGEWLRREQRRVEAREQLRAAYEMFDSMGAEAFAERARRELLATGETVRVRTPNTRTQLTAQEAQIAQLARDGLSNPEIAARLFISPRTVQYHRYRRAFTTPAAAHHTAALHGSPETVGIADPGCRGKRRAALSGRDHLRARAGGSGRSGGGRQRR